MRLFVVDPLALDVFLGDVKVNATIGDRPTIASPMATNQLDPQLRRQWVRMLNALSCDVVVSSCDALVFLYGGAFFFLSLQCHPLSCTPRTPCLC